MLKHHVRISIGLLFLATWMVANSCTAAMDSGLVSEAANERALELMRGAKLEATIVMQDVRNGALVAFAASAPSKLEVTSAVLPLSTVKLMVAAAWLDHENAPVLSPESERLLSDSIVSGNDNAGRRMASTLRASIGTKAFLKDLQRYGFGNASKGKDESFWAELAPRWKEKLMPAAAYHSLGPTTAAKDWEDTLSLGEERFVVTALHLSRFLQAVGNDGVMAAAVAREEARPGSTIPAPTRVMSETAARKLQAAMRATVERGTAKSAGWILSGTGWAMGGKTGTGPGPEPPGPNSDGCFAGLIFDAEGRARFTVATFVKHGGLGGGNAARISAEMARFFAGSKPAP